jgi:tRNA nucleotidyltransferase/poly(A) polymerase
MEFEQESMSVLIPELAQVMSALESIGGKPYLVGGAVGDLIRGEKPRDLDVEVFGIGDEDILRSLRPLAENAHKQYFSAQLQFGDFSIDVSCGPTSTIEDPKFTRSRDFTINSLYWREGVVYDPIGCGLSDVRSGILRQVNEEVWDDRIRVWRAIQLFARKCSRVDRYTETCLRRVVHQLSVGSFRRRSVIRELKKLLLARNPAKGVILLKRIGGLDLLPDLPQSIGKSWGTYLPSEIEGSDQPQTFAQRPLAALSRP